MRRLLAAALLAAVATHCPAPAAQQTIGAEVLRERAEAGDVRAMRALAEAYYLGRGGVTQDFAAAARWYRKLAARGEAGAQTTLGLMYARGWGLAPNLAEARRWWSLAAAQNDPGAQHNLGMVYLQGQGVARDLPQALHWLRRAAERGHVAAQRIVGLMYYDGEGTTRDVETGLTWLTIAAENGEEGAQQALQAIAGKVSGQERSEARARALEWIKAHPPR
ncbi:MAG: tetratricopeptide repeat protein [Burkholderiales bacterium]